MESPSTPDLTHSAKAPVKAAADAMSGARRDRSRKLKYMADYNAREDVKRRAKEREQTPKYKAMRKLYRDKKRALKQGLTPSQIAARIELGLDLLS